MRIERSIFQHIEFELYNYEETMKKLELYKEQILHSTSRPETAVQSGLSDTTASKAVKLSSSPFIQRCEELKSAVESSLNQLGEKHRKLFRYKYIENRKIEDIILLLNTSRRGYFRYRKDIVMLVGQKMGWIE